MKLIINCETNETIERELNKTEKDQQKLDAVNYNEEIAVEKSQIEANAAAKSALLEKLGITADEAKLLLG